ncbi:hypothetical protein [Streptomyces sp. NPDC059455]|uniref:hypothetical protein n=1 Tax=Streptomyces sp. NPDC059455 TaxID=3346837 RepID=UPI00368DBDB9
MGSRWKGHVTRHPLWGAVELTLARHVVLVLFATVILPPLVPSWFPDLGAAVVNAVCFAGVWLVLWRWEWLRASGVATPGRVRRWWLGVPMLPGGLRCLDRLPGAVSTGRDEDERMTAIALRLGAFRWAAAPMR